jgi:chorismate mutase
VNAAATGLSLAIAEPVWRAILEASIAYELTVFDRK